MGHPAYQTSINLLICILLEDIISDRLDIIGNKYKTQSPYHLWKEYYFVILEEIRIRWKADEKTLHMIFVIYSFQIQDQRYRSLVYIVPSVLAALLMNIPRYVTVMDESFYYADFGLYYYPCH